MEYAICNISHAPMRAEPSDRSEMVSQLLFGELFGILEVDKQWLYIKCDYDDYTGWIDHKQCRPVSEEFANKMKSKLHSSSSEILQLAVNQSRKIVLPIVLGSTLPFLNNNTFLIDDDIYSFEGQHSGISNLSRDKVKETSLLYMNAPYLWGGRSPFGIDCSGFIQMVYKICGIKLPRDANQQAHHGVLTSFVSEALPGDIAFFENDEGEIIHTGIILNENKIIHASGRVRVDNLDHEGIFNLDLQRYTHKLRLVKSVF